MINLDSTFVPIKEMFALAKQFANYYGRIGTCDPDDICQTAMLALVKQKPYPYKPVHWLRKVVRNEAMNAGRKYIQDRRYLVDYGDLQTALSVSEMAGQVYEHVILAARTQTSEPDLSTQIEIALSRLPEEMRQVLLLYAEGYNYHEIAEMTDSKVGTVRSRLSRARRFARKMLADLA